MKHLLTAIKSVPLFAMLKTLWEHDAFVDSFEGE
jgi:hypothetical protein